MKAQQYFGGTSRKTQPDPTLRQVGNSSATSGVNSISNNRVMADTKAYKPKTSPAHRPSLPGKVDNRKVGQ